MRYDLIAPQAVLDALGAMDAQPSEHPVGELIAAEPLSSALDSADFLLAPPAEKSPEQYSHMVLAAINAARKATLQTVGELDISLAGDATGWSREVGSNAAQQALDQMSASDADHDEESWAIEPDTFSVDAFAQELRLRGFPADIAQSHAEALGALLDEDAPRPEGMSATVEIRLDPQTQRMESAALHVGRRNSSRLATAEIRWVAVNGMATPQAEVSLAYVH